MHGRRRLPEECPTAERVRTLLHYDPESGVFTWRLQVGPVAPGTRAGCIARGYRRIAIDGADYLASHIAWLYMTGEWPPREVDHKSTNPGDDRWDNLRLATSSQNKTNSRRRSDNTSGFKGVHFYKAAKRWAAAIWLSKRKVHLGYFDTAEEAHAAYCEAAKQHFGEFARP